MRWGDSAPRLEFSCRRRAASAKRSLFQDLEARSNAICLGP